MSCRTIFSVNSKFFDAMLGSSKCKELMNQFSHALDSVNRILIVNPNIVGVVVEKMKLQLCSQDWDQCNEVAMRCLTLDNECLEAFRYQILELLCKDGRYNDVSVKFKASFTNYHFYCYIGC